MKKKTNHLLKIAVSGFSIFCIQFFSGQGTFAQDSKTSEPIIISFNIVATTTTQDGVEMQWNEFSWKTEGAEKVRLYRDSIEIKGRDRLPDGEVGWPVSLDGGFKSKAGRVATYKLIAENSHGEVSKTLETKMLVNEIPTTPELPDILTFDIKITKESSGVKATFYWQTKGAYQVQLFDSFGEIESRIVLEKGNFGWPLQMDGALEESLNKSETYKLVATGKTGSATKSKNVTVEEKSCPVTVTVRGTFSKFTDYIVVYLEEPGNSKEVLFNKKVGTVQDNRKGKEGQFQRVKMTLTPGHYSFSASGGGKDSHGDFAVLYKSEKSDFVCAGGNPGQINFETRGTEY